MMGSYGRFMVSRFLASQRARGNDVAVSPAGGLPESPKQRLLNRAANAEVGSRFNVRLEAEIYKTSFDTYEVLGKVYNLDQLSAIIDDGGHMPV